MNGYELHDQRWEQTFKVIRRYFANLSSTVNRRVVAESVRKPTHDRRFCVLDFQNAFVFPGFTASLSGLSHNASRPILVELSLYGMPLSLCAVKQAASGFLKLDEDLSI